MSVITFRSIGIIHSPFAQPGDMPIQPLVAKGIKGAIDLDPEFEAGLKDLGGFSHVILLYHFHLSRGYSLHVVPFMDDVERGIFATRAPRRPNPLGLSIVRLEGIDGCHLSIADVDVVEGTPLIDIKPFVPYFDHRDGATSGWLTKRLDKVHERRSDDRFI